MKVDVVFIIGPTNNFQPLTQPKFKLPFVNVPLLKLSVNYLFPYASRIFIVCLEKYSEEIKLMLNDYKIPIEIIKTQSYEGMGYILNILKNKIKSDFFILSKGDIYGKEPILPLLTGFSALNDDLYVSIEKSNKKDTLICINFENKLISYNPEEVKIVNQMKMTVDYVVKDFYLIKKRLLKSVEFTNDLYGFKKNVIPYLINQNLNIRVGENCIFQVRNIKDYLKQLNFKNLIQNTNESNEFNLIDQNIMLSNGVKIRNSIIGSNVKLGYKTEVNRSIIFDNVELMSEVKYENCIVDSENLIYKFNDF
jgi:NDP-sugar pyrophosphorylase family protein